ncbi:MAG: hypothetical protein MAG715_00340 [Methanonatronarchaeales archaeon]|nr:hypothetical protein [Methanonatronarchaeales archaeon]
MGGPLPLKGKDPGYELIDGIEGTTGKRPSTLQVHLFL